MYDVWFQVLFLSHPKKMTRDTARYKAFRQQFNGRTPSLKNLTDKLLGVSIQSGEHNSVSDLKQLQCNYSHPPFYIVVRKHRMEHKTTPLTVSPEIML